MTTETTKNAPVEEENHAIGLSAMPLITSSQFTSPNELSKIHHQMTTATTSGIAQGSATSRASDGPALEVLVDEERGRHADHEAGRGDGEDQLEADPAASPELVRTKQLLVVCEGPRLARRADARNLDLLQAEVERQQQRIDDDEEHQQHRRCEEQVGELPLVARAGEVPVAEPTPPARIKAGRSGSSRVSRRNPVRSCRNDAVASFARDPCPAAAVLRGGRGHEARMQPGPLLELDRLGLDGSPHVGRIEVLDQHPLHLFEDDLRELVELDLQPEGNAVDAGLGGRLLGLDQEVEMGNGVLGRLGDRARAWVPAWPRARRSAPGNAAR